LKTAPGANEIVHVMVDIIHFSAFDPEGMIFYIFSFATSGAGLGSGAGVFHFINELVVLCLLGFVAPFAFRFLHARRFIDIFPLGPYMT
jgi:hypothetical protein